MLGRPVIRAIAPVCRRPRCHIEALLGGPSAVCSWSAVIMVSPGYPLRHARLRLSLPAERRNGHRINILDGRIGLWPANLRARIAVESFQRGAPVSNVATTVDVIVLRLSRWRDQDLHDAFCASSFLLSLGAAFARMKRERHGRPSGSLQALCSHCNPRLLIVVASRSRCLTSRTGTTGVDVIVADYVILTEVDACLDLNQDHGYLSRILHAMDRTQGNVN
jgi:hypothetical protein